MRSLQKKIQTTESAYDVCTEDLFNQVILILIMILMLMLFANVVFIDDADTDADVVADAFCTGESSMRISFVRQSSHY